MTWSRKKVIHSFYKKLLHHFGHQGWWPTTLSHGTHPIYTPRKSLKKNTEQEKFEICIGAILTQNTSWTNVVKVLSGLKKNGLLSFKALRKLTPGRLAPHLRSSGYFRQKARRLHGFLKQVDQEENGRFSTFLDGNLLTVREKLLNMNGIGPETADSMLLYAQGHPIFVVDAYTRRIATRWGFLKGNETYEAIQSQFMNALPRSASLFGEYHALFVELAKRNCRVKPICETCCLKKECATGRKQK